MNQELLLTTLRAPHMSEKAAIIKEQNQYVFEVARTATKPQIKAAVELMFKVIVAAVNTTNVKPKKKRFRNIEGKVKGWKKAYVTLAEGQSIDFAGA